MHFGRSARDPHIRPEDEKAAEDYMAIRDTDQWRLRMASLTPRERVGAIHAAQVLLEDAEYDGRIARMEGNARAERAAQQEQQRWQQQLLAHRRMLAVERLA